MTLILHRHHYIQRIMLWVTKKRYIKRVAFATFKLLTLIFIVIFVIFPLSYKYSYKLQSSAVFLNFLHVPSDANYKNPSSYGLYGSRNFYVTHDGGVKLGVWHILPENHTYPDYDSNEERYFEEALANGQDVIIYHHGNAGTRLTAHRVELYAILRKHFHVIAFDYRSYGDSSNVVPSEDKVVNDSMFIYEWVQNRTKGNVFVWGHSLGTSIALHSMALLQEKGITPAGIILESPFNNMRDEISEFPLARLFKNLPWFSYTVIDPMQENGFLFQSDKHICKVDAPIIILHAEDDHVVPFKLGRKLYQEGIECRKEDQGPLLFRAFDGKHGYDHKFICRAPELHDIIRNFTSIALKDRTKVL
nr:unnamed protein product [Callosobruchus analis]